MLRARLLLSVGALLALPLCSAAWAAETTPPAAVAYPASPNGTPATATAGTAPAPSGQTNCPATGPCPDSPAPSAQADNASSGGKVQPGVIATPSTAYPDSPVKTPAADPSGTAPKQK